MMQVLKKETQNKENETDSADLVIIHRRSFFPNFFCKEHWYMQYQNRLSLTDKYKLKRGQVFL